MARTFAEAVRIIRTSIQDVRTPQRWDDQVIADALVMAFADVKRMRPDLFVGTAKNYVVPSNPAVLFNDGWPLAEFTFAPMIRLAISHIEFADDQSVVDERAKQKLQIATAQLMGTA